MAANVKVGCIFRDTDSEVPIGGAVIRCNGTQKLFHIERTEMRELVVDGDRQSRCVVYATSSTEANVSRSGAPPARPVPFDELTPRPYIIVRFGDEVPKSIELAARVAS